MNIKKISYGLIGAIMAAGFFSSCSNSKYENKAKTEALKYLREDELMKAERFARQQANYGEDNGEAVAYWDSLLIDAKSKEAYAKGQQYVRDSLNKIYYRKERFKPELDKIFSSNIAESSRNEYANYVKSDDFVKAKKNAPKDAHISFFSDKAATTHYWNMITLAGKQKEAYNKGITDARNELTK